MCNCNEKLTNLIQETIEYPIHSKEYRRNLNLIIFEMQQSGKILKPSANNRNVYDDALQNAWLSFRKDLPKYNHERECIFTWFNRCLSWRIKDELRKTTKYQQNRVTSFGDEKTGEFINPIDLIPAPPDFSDEHEEIRKIGKIRQWINNNQQKLRCPYTKNHSENNSCNCYNLLLDRLLYETSWRKLAEKYGIPHNTLSTHYKKHCLPLLAEWLQEQGYRR